MRDAKPHQPLPFSCRLRRQLVGFGEGAQLREHALHAWRVRVGRVDSADDGPLIPRPTGREERRGAVSAVLRVEVQQGAERPVLVTAKDRQVLVEVRG